MKSNCLVIWVATLATVAIWAGAAPAAQSAVAGGSPTALRATMYASGFSSPVAFVQDPSDAAVQYVVEQAGRIRVVRNGIVIAPDFLNLTAAVASGGERGLLGLAFSPDYATSGRFYVNFTNTAGHTVVARFRRSSNPLVADPGSRFDLRWNGAGGSRFIAQPFANHNGGHLAFGPDGFLYIGLGDGGAADDPAHRAQTPSELLGKMLRIDVNVPDSDPIGYQVPASNPFVGAGPAGTRPEIWSFGWRNPWRYSFDDPARGGTGALVAGDVGQGRWEEVDYEPPNRGGRNYGWRNREGAHDHILSVPPAFVPLVDPIHDYDRSVGQSITGGYVYRGSALGPTYRGRYFFADFIQGRVWSMGLTINPSTGEASKADLVEHTAALGGSGTIGNVSSFGVDGAGELYIVSYSGAIFKLIGARAGTDFDADGKADLVVFRPSSGNWFIRDSASSYATSTVRQWGIGGDVPVAGDYDGDRTTDVAIWRPSNGFWFILTSTSGFITPTVVQWGEATDVPVPGDYDGDGREDVAAYRPSTGVWYILHSSPSSAGTAALQWGVVGDIPVPGDYDGDGKADLTVFRPSTGTWHILKSSSGSTTSIAIQWGSSGDVPVPGDYDADVTTDLAVYRPGTGIWYVLQSSTSFTTSVSFQWGAGTDVPVPSDYDGDGVADIAVYRPATGTWYVRQSTTGYATSVSYQWGLSDDIPTPNGPIAHAMVVTASPLVPPANLRRSADLDGDGKADLTVYRPSAGTWFNLRSVGNLTTAVAFQWGASGEIPVSSDYDGDGKTELAVYRPLSGTWLIRQATCEPATFTLTCVLFRATTDKTFQWGAGGDVPVPDDYDGDGIGDIGVFRPSTGEWLLRLSANVPYASSVPSPGTPYAASATFQWGASGDVPVPGDYDGDGMTDLAVYRPLTGVWHILRSGTNYTTAAAIQWGASGDITVPGDYDGDSTIDPAVYRPSTGVWYILQSSTNFTASVAYPWGLSSDVPVPGDFDGDGRTDPAVWRPSTGVWYVLKSSTSFTISDAVQWGLSSDIPILGRR